MRPFHKMQTDRLARRIRLLIWLIIVGLVASGLTALPILSELETALRLMEVNHWSGALWDWMEKVFHGVRLTDSRYPFIAYGTDWLAFAHLAIAVAFVGPLKDPVRNIWVIEFGLIACMGIFPFAMIAGEIREIPYFWRLIDCSFGLFGGVLLYICHGMIKRLEIAQRVNLL